MGTIEQTGVDDRRPTTNETKMKTMMMMTTWMVLSLLLIGACAQAPPTPQDAPAAPATEDAPAAPATEDAPAAPAADAGDQGASGAVDSAGAAEKPETIGEDWRTIQMEPMMVCQSLRSQPLLSVMRRITCVTQVKECNRPHCTASTTTARHTRTGTMG